MIDAVIFDLDRTLLDKDRSLVRFAKVQYADFSLSRFEVEERAFVSRFVELHSRIMPKEDVYRELLDEFRIDRTRHAELLDDLNRRFPLCSIGFPGLNGMLDTLRRARCKLGLLTNGRAFYQQNKLTALGIADAFDDIVISGAVNLSKPDLAIFRLALARLGAAPERTVFVGDSLEADIRPARALGMRTILKGHGESCPDADAVCDRLADLPALIGRLGQDKGPD